MFRNDLYTAGKIIQNDSGCSVPIALNPAHPIFRGHFPGQPVLPGVCMIEMLKEVLEDLLRQELRISGAPVIKFLAMIVPDKTPDFTIELSYERAAAAIQVQGRIFSGKTVFMKCQLELIPAPA